MFPRLAVATLLAVTCSIIPGIAAAADDDAKPREVVIQDIHAPELKTYRAMLAGLDEFEDRHALAPNAPEVRFRLRPRGRQPAADLSTLKLRISLDADSIPLPLAADQSFILPRNAQAKKENGDLVLNQPKGAYEWQPDVFSAGVPANMRRLGDLRLECRVQVAVIKEEIPFWARLLVNSILLTSDWCSVEKLSLSTHSDRTLDAAWLLVGDQRIKVHLSSSGHGFMAPIGEKKYPDDTLIELVYAAPGTDVIPEAD